MRKHIIFVIFVALIACACENKRDTNGDLGGFWQLMQWRNPKDSLIATDESKIFYSVQLTLLKLHRLSDGYSNYYLSYFNHKNDSLIIYRPVRFVNDSIVSITDLAKYGVPSDGRFHIDVLTEESLQLSSEETGVLVFRKY